MSIPSLVPPIQDPQTKHLLYDGGLVDNLPGTFADQNTIIKAVTFFV